MGNQKRRKRPLLYIFGISLLTVGYVFISMDYGDTEQNTLGIQVIDDVPEQDFEEIHLDGINDSLFYQEERKMQGGEVCDQFPEYYLAGYIDESITQLQNVINGNTIGCIYHLQGNDRTISILVKEGSAENKKRGHELIGRVVVNEVSISGPNYVVKNAQKEIIEIYLIINDTRYIQISGTNTSFALNKKLLDLADDISKELKIYHLN